MAQNDNQLPPVSVRVQAPAAFKDLYQHHMSWQITGDELVAVIESVVNTLRVEGTNVQAPMRELVESALRRYRVGD